MFAVIFSLTLIPVTVPCPTLQNILKKGSRPHSERNQMERRKHESSYTGCLVPLHTAPQLRRSKYRIPSEARSNPVLLTDYACL